MPNDKPSMEVLFLDFFDGRPINGCLRIRKNADSKPRDIVWLKSGNYAMRASQDNHIQDWCAIQDILRPVARWLVADHVYEGGTPVSGSRGPATLHKLDGDVNTNGIRLAYVSLIRDPFSHMGYTQTIDLAWFSPDGSIRSLDGQPSGHVYLNHNTSDDTWHIGGATELPETYLRELAAVLLDMFAGLVRLDPNLPEISD